MNIMSDDVITTVGFGKFVKVMSSVVVGVPDNVHDTYTESLETVQEPMLVPLSVTVAVPAVNEANPFTGMLL